MPVYASGKNRDYLPGALCIWTALCIALAAGDAQTTPREGDVFYPGDDIVVRWDAGSSGGLGHFNEVDVLLNVACTPAEVKDRCSRSRGTPLVLDMGIAVKNEGSFRWRITEDFFPGIFFVTVMPAQGTARSVHPPQGHFNILLRDPKGDNNHWLQVLTPDSSTVAQAGSSLQVTWRSRGLGPLVEIVLVNKAGGNNAAVVVKGPIENDGEYTWHVPSSQAGGAYFLCVRSVPMTVTKIEGCGPTQGSFKINSSGGGDAPKPRAAFKFFGVLVSNTEARFQADVISLQSELEQSGYEVTSIPGASRLDVLSAVADLALRADRDDVVVFFTSGHGRLDEDGGLLLDYGTPPALAAADLASGLKLVRSTKVLIVIHSCHAGGFPELTGPDTDANTQRASSAEVAELMNDMSGHVTIFAGSRDLPTYGNVFSQGFASAFKRARKRQKSLDWAQIFSVVTQYVDDRWNAKHPDQMFRPQISASRANSFPLWLPVGHQGLRKPSPPKLTRTDL